MRVLYFAWLRQRVGVAEEQVDPPPEVTDVGGLIRWLATRDAAHAHAFDQPRQVRAAVNQVFAGADHAVARGDEIAFFPPVTGG